MGTGPSFPVQLEWHLEQIPLPKPNNINLIKLHLTHRNQFPVYAWFIFPSKSRTYSSKFIMCVLVLWGSTKHKKHHLPINICTQPNGEPKHTFSILLEAVKCCKIHATQVIAEIDLVVNKQPSQHQRIFIVMNTEWNEGDLKTMCWGGGGGVVAHCWGEMCKCVWQTAELSEVWDTV